MFERTLLMKIPIFVCFFLLSAKSNLLLPSSIYFSINSDVNNSAVHVNLKQFVSHSVFRICNNCANLVTGISKSHTIRRFDENIEKRRASMN